MPARKRKREDGSSSGEGYYRAHADNYRPGLRSRRSRIPVDGNCYDGKEIIASDTIISNCTLQVIKRLSRTKHMNRRTGSNESPVHRLPYEIQDNIMQWLAPDDILALSSTCAHARVIFLQQPHWIGLAGCLPYLNDALPQPARATALDRMGLPSSPPDGGTHAVNMKQLTFALLVHAEHLTGHQKRDRHAIIQNFATMATRTISEVAYVREVRQHVQSIMIESAKSIADVLYDPCTLAVTYMQTVIPLRFLCTLLVHCELRRGALGRALKEESNCLGYRITPPNFRFNTENNDFAWQQTLFQQNVPMSVAHVVRVSEACDVFAAVFLARGDAARKIPVPDGPTEGNFQQLAAIGMHLLRTRTESACSLQLVNDDDQKKPYASLRFEPPVVFQRFMDVCCDPQRQRSTYPSTWFILNIAEFHRFYFTVSSAPTEREDSFDFVPLYVFRTLVAGQTEYAIAPATVRDNWYLSLQTAMFLPYA